MKVLRGKLKSSTLADEDNIGMLFLHRGATEIKLGGGGKLNFWK